MKKQLFFLILVSFLPVAYGQNTYTHTILFPTDKHTITKLEMDKLRQFVSSLNNKTIETIHMNGHTDSDGSGSYNKDLSKRRVNMVKDRLSSLLPGSIDMSLGFFGEDKPVDVNSNDNGKQKNRRVDITVTTAETIPVEPHIIETTEPCKESKGDTIIELSKGTLLILPKAEYLSNPDGIFVEEYVDGESVREAGLTTMADDGSTLMSGGMFKIKDCEDDKCRTILISVRTACGQEVQFTQWIASSINDSWSEDSGNPLLTRTIDGNRYYEMTICGCNYVNCDFRVPAEESNFLSRKTRIKLKNGYKINSIRIATNEPLIVQTPLKKTSTKAVFPRTCSCTEPLIYIEATNRDGELKTIEYKPLNEFDKRETHGACKTAETEKRILFFKVKKKMKYRKYLIRKSDFD